jgi:hypothetical protein
MYGGGSVDLFWWLLAGTLFVCSPLRWRQYTGNTQHPLVNVLYCGQQTEGRVRTCTAREILQGCKAKWLVAPDCVWWLQHQRHIPNSQGCHADVLRSARYIEEVKPSLYVLRSTAQPQHQATKPDS